MYWVAVMRSALLSFLSTPSVYDPSSTNLCMSVNHGFFPYTSLSRALISSSCAGKAFCNIEIGQTEIFSGMSTNDARVAKTSTNWFWARGMKVYSILSNLLANFST